MANPHMRQVIAPVLIPRKAITNPLRYPHALCVFSRLYNRTTVNACFPHHNHLSPNYLTITPREKRATNTRLSYSARRSRRRKSHRPWHVYRSHYMVSIIQLMRWACFAWTNSATRIASRNYTAETGRSVYGWWVSHIYRSEFFFLFLFCVLYSKIRSRITNRSTIGIIIRALETEATDT